MKFKLLLLLILLPFNITSCTSTSLIQKTSNLPRFNTTKTNGHNTSPSIIRLVSPENNFFCTGFVIDGIYALTAAHCVTGLLGKLSTDSIKIYDSYENYTGEATAVALNAYQDVALIKGDFSNFEAKPTDFDGKNSKLGMHVLACGFPAGQFNLYCAELVHVGNKYFRYAMMGGPIYKGQSGGPVIEVTSGNVIGVNSAVDEDTVIVSPIVGVLDGWGVK